MRMLFNEDIAIVNGDLNAKVRFDNTLIEHGRRNAVLVTVATLATRFEAFSSFHQGVLGGIWFDYKFCHHHHLIVICLFLRIACSGANEIVGYAARPAHKT